MLKKGLIHLVVLAGGVAIGFVAGKAYFRPSASGGTSVSPQKELAQPTNTVELEEKGSSEPEQQPEAQTVVQRAQQEVKREIRKIERSIPADTLPVALPVADSIPADTQTAPVFTRNPDSGEIVVKQELRLGTLEIPIMRYDESNADTTRSDTAIERLLAEVSDITTEEERDIRIEFWESPVNFRGYKMGNHILVVFGLEPDTNIALLEVKQQLYLKHLENFYIIDRTFDFKPLRQETRTEQILELQGL